MQDSDITLFAEIIYNQFGPEAGAEALRRARHFENRGDSKNAEAWLVIRDRLRGRGHNAHERRGFSAAV